MRRQGRIGKGLHYLTRELGTYSIYFLTSSAFGFIHPLCVYFFFSFAVVCFFTVHMDLTQSRSPPYHHMPTGSQSRNKLAMASIALTTADQVHMLATHQYVFKRFQLI